MKTSINIFTLDWCNLVFEGKNKNYGAYELRQMSSKRHTLAIILSVTIFAIGVSAPVLLKKIAPPDHNGGNDPNKLTAVVIDKPEQPDIPIEQPKPALRRTIQFTPPEISDDATEDDMPPLIDVLRNTDAAISSESQEGLDELNAPLPDLSAVEQTTEPVRFVPQMPEFVGGEEARIQFLKENLRYPSIASEIGITGKVILQFVVDKEGKIDRVSVIRGIGGGCDEEAIRVTKLMPKWKAGRQNGRPVPVYFIMSIGFALQN
jgi:periplasmic protein TonB